MVFSLVLFGCGKKEPAAETTTETTEETKSQTQEVEVTFITEDGIDINENIFGSGNKWVILSHMFSTNQTSWFGFAQYLADNGYMALTYDFRGYGKSGGKQDISNIDKDLEAALVFVRQHNVEKVFLMGASMGATVSLIVASRQSVDGVISFSSPVKIMSLSAINIIKNINAPKLFIASLGDIAEAANARAFCQASS